MYADQFHPPISPARADGTPCFRVILMSNCSDLPTLKTPLTFPPPHHCVPSTTLTSSSGTPSTSMLPSPFLSIMHLYQGRLIRLIVFQSFSPIILQWKSNLAFPDSYCSSTISHSTLFPNVQNNALPNSSNTCFVNVRPIAKGFTEQLTSSFIFHISMISHVRLSARIFPSVKLMFRNLSVPNDSHVNHFHS